jgi:hypothetical protein
MAGTFVCSFSVAQSASGQNIVITDTSNYAASSEPYTGFSARVVTVTLTGGNTITVPAFPYVAGTGDTVSFAISQDYCMSINMTVTPVSPVGGSVYTKTGLYTVVNYTQSFIYGILQNVAANQSLMQDPIYQKSLFTLYNELSNAKLAGNTYNDQLSSQNALNRALYIMNNPTLFF